MSYTATFKDDSSALTHWGIKGQKWGVRRYQNEDGSLTPEGEKRYSQIEKVKSGAKYGAAALIGVGGNASSVGLSSLSTAVSSRSKNDNDEKAKVSRELNETSKSVKRNSDTYSEALIKKTEEEDLKRLKNAMDLTKMSDNELQTKIKRLNLEKQYRQLTTPETTSGAEIAREVIGIASGISAFALDGINIAKGIKDLAKGD